MIVARPKVTDSRSLFLKLLRDMQCAARKLTRREIPQLFEGNNVSADV